MKLIVNLKERKVFYDDKNEVYIKEFFPNFERRLKCFFRLRKYPGENFFYAAKKLNQLGIKTPEVVEYSRYRVVTKAVQGQLLADYFVDNNNPKIELKFLDMIVNVLNHRIYHKDFRPGNFIIRDGEIYAIDLEDYKIDVIHAWNHQELISRLHKTLKNDNWVAYIEERLTKR